MFYPGVCCLSRRWRYLRRVWAGRKLKNKQTNKKYWNNNMYDTATTHWGSHPAGWDDWENSKYEGDRQIVNISAIRYQLAFCSRMRCRFLLNTHAENLTWTLLFFVCSTNFTKCFQRFFLSELIYLKAAVFSQSFPYQWIAEVGRFAF